MQRLAIAIAIVVTAVWALGATLAFLNSADNPQLVTLVTIITPVVGIIVGGLFAPAILDRGKRGRNGDKR